jgi:hypothetical protein
VPFFAAAARTVTVTKAPHMGPHSVIRAVGTQESMLQAIRSARPGGHVRYVGVAQEGVTPPADEPFFAAVHLHGGPAPVCRFLPELIQLILDRKINPGKVFDLTPAARPGRGGLHRDGQAPRWTSAAHQTAPHTLSSDLVEAFVVDDQGTVDRYHSARGAGICVTDISESGRVQAKHRMGRHDVSVVGR